MKKIEYWIIDLAMGNPISIDFIESRMNRVNNIFEKISLDETVEILYKLFQEGLLLAITQMDLNLFNPRLLDDLLVRSFIPSHDEIKSVFSSLSIMKTIDDEEVADQVFNQNSVSFFLTEKGGKAWESFFPSDWNYFCRRNTMPWEKSFQSLNHKASNRETIWGSDKNIIKKLIDFNSFLHYPDFLCYPAQGSETWETSTPWYPVYWKSLPIGYGVNYIVEYTEDIEIRECLKLEKKREILEKWHQEKIALFSYGY